ncbi:hypothetical protein [Bacterioplanoides sp. SCSIO 12839]|uniref:hypothetical protein n=1 Tax=Bacterioplanoides sp. SCSIO 12839 TaxID=2829569 RepID=UPI00210252AA|nr:hypothetical protein [Bacterioplanoides sp. SCSIO 12839]UTW46961.1 hypothetical protein KFF03_10165 [Bacterioplanoides sp. SCSIO 12839]
MAATIDAPQSGTEQSQNDQITQLEQEIQRISNKLSNSGYVSKAPAAAIEKERIRLEKFEQSLKTLRERQAS